MARIDNLEVVIWQGQIRQEQRSKRIHTREGVDGSGIVRGSLRAIPSPVRTLTTVASVAAARRLIRDYADKDATIVDLVDDEGTVHANVAVLQVKAEFFASPVIDGAVTDGDTYVVQCDWVFLPGHQDQAPAGVI